MKKAWCIRMDNFRKFDKLSETLCTVYCPSPAPAWKFSLALLPMLNAYKLKHLEMVPKTLSLNSQLPSLRCISPGGVEQWLMVQGFCDPIHSPESIVFEYPIVIVGKSRARGEVPITVSVRFRSVCRVCNGTWCGEKICNWPTVNGAVQKMCNWPTGQLWDNWTGVQLPAWIFFESGVRVAFGTSYCVSGIGTWG